MDDPECGMDAALDSELDELALDQALAKRNAKAEEKQRVLYQCRQLELLQEEQYHRARLGLLNFTLATFPKYQVNWHHRKLCQALNRFALGETKRLIVTLPPRHGKSQLVSRQLPAFVFGRNPRAKFIAASYSADLASSMNRDVQRIMDSEIYRAIFPETTLRGSRPSPGTTAWMRNSGLFEIVGYGGSYRSVGVGGGVTGMGADFICIDDPIKNQEEADSMVYREKLWNWYTSTLYSRLEKDAGICVTATRWNEDDLIGRLLKLAHDDPQADQWELINFPAVAEGAPREEDLRLVGEALWPEKYDVEALAKIKINQGARNWSALYQQRPAPEGGMIVHRKWWKFYDKFPEQFDKILMAWDLTFTKSATSDYVVGVVLGKIGADIYLLDLVRDRLSFTDSIAAMKRLAVKWPQAELKLVEEAANGYALIDTLRAEVSGLVPVRPLGSKVARANAVSPRIESGNMWLPSRELAPGWGGPDGDVVMEWTSFPAGRHDDIVDAMCHGLLRLIAEVTTDFLPVSITQANKFDW